MKPVRPYSALALALTFASPAPSVLAAPGEITLVSWLPLESMCTASDVWGYRDPATSRYYALVGDFGDRLHVIDVTDATNPQRIALVSSFPAADVETWRDPSSGRIYAYACAEHGCAPAGCSTAILDLTDPANPLRLPGTLPPAHSVSISADGFLTLSVRRFTPQGNYVYDLNPNPQLPTLVWQDLGHDVHDTTPKGDRLYAFDGYTGVRVWDISGLPATPPTTPVRTIPHGRDVTGTPYTTDVFSHSGSVTEDGVYLFICDELAFRPPGRYLEDIYVWDIYSDPPVFIRSIADENATVHNLHVVDRFAFVSFYAAGFRVYDVSLPSLAVPLLDEFDTSPSFEEVGFVGNYGVYPFDHRGYVYASDSQTGFFVFAVDGFTRVPYLQPGPPGPPATRVSGVVRTVGGVAVPGVVLNFDCLCGCDVPVTTDVNGFYSIVVAYNWKGQSVPQPSGDYTYMFNATGQPYADYTGGVTGSLTNQNFTRLEPGGPPKCKPCEISPSGRVGDAHVGAVPNPFSRDTDIRFRTNSSGAVMLRILDVHGRQIRGASLRELSAGEHSWQWDGLDDSGRRAGPGMYFATIQLGYQRDVLRIVKTD